VEHIQQKIMNEQALIIQ